MSEPYSETELRSACRVLFGTVLDPPVEFFSYLQPEGVKAAFRKRARETHPDTCTDNGFYQAVSPEPFHRVTEAYNLLYSFAKQKKPVSAPAKPGDHDQFHCNNANRHLYHRGPLPLRQLEIGRYLYYRGIIPHQSLISALVWQRAQRPLLGQIARNWGFLSDAAVQIILRSSNSGLFGEKAVRKGLLTRHKLSLLLSHQRSRQQKLGKYFVQSGYLSEDEIEKAVLEMQRHNAQFKGQAW